MKSDRATLVLRKVAIAIIAFCIGSIIMFVLSIFAQDAGIWPKTDASGGLWSGLLGLSLQCGLCGLGGIIAAGISLLIDPTITLRIYHVVTGLFVLALGTLSVVANSSVFWRYIFGPIAVVAALYVLCMAVFGRRSDVEDL